MVRERLKTAKRPVRDKWLLSPQSHASRGKMEDEKVDEVY